MYIIISVITIFVYVAIMSLVLFTILNFMLIFEDFGENISYVLKRVSGQIEKLIIKWEYDFWFSLRYHSFVTDCHSSCSDCFLSPGGNKTIQCIKCKNQQYSIYKDECIPECSSVFYLNSHNTCTGKVFCCFIYCFIFLCFSAKPFKGWSKTYKRNRNSIFWEQQKKYIARIAPFSTNS